VPPSDAEEATADCWFVRTVERLSTAGGVAAAAAVLALMLLISLEVFMRNFLGRSTMISDEWSGYLYAAIVFLGVGQTLRDGGFIRVEALYDRLRGRTLKTVRWVFVLATLAYVVVLFGDAVRQVTYLYRGNIRSDSLTQTALYLPQSLMVIGWGLLLLQLLTYVVKGMRDVP
jgi:TRAP-type transport system small permease protein